MGGTLLVPFVRSFAGITSNERLARETTEKMNGYIALYRGKRIEVHAETSHQAQTIAAGKFKAKKSYEVSVYLAEKDGEQVTHTATE